MFFCYNGLYKGHFCKAFRPSFFRFCNKRKDLLIKADCVIRIALRWLLFEGISKPPSLSVVASTSSSIYIRWTKPDLGDKFAAITGYHIWLDAIRSHSSPPHLFVDTNTSTNITNLLSNTKYNIYVRARSETGQFYGDSSRTIGSTRT